MSFPIEVISTADVDARSALQRLRTKLSPDGTMVSAAGRAKTVAVFGEPLSPAAAVERICRDVKGKGLEAALRYTQQLDDRSLDGRTLRVSEAELAEAHASVPVDFLETVRRIRANVEEFQRACLPEDVSLLRESAGRVQLRQRYVPMDRVGLCVPGGAAAYPSTVLMTAVPAMAAGVPEVVVVCPPTDFGGYNPILLATCHELGIREVYRIGGAQGVAALAYGLDLAEDRRLRPVDKIVGPGNLFVALAKRHVFGQVDIDSIAGPSEVIVLADASADPGYVAADLISQAEHSPGSGILITWHAPLIEAVREELTRQLAGLSRGELAGVSLQEYGALLLARDESEACELTDWIATEHLHISTADPEHTLGRVKNAGAIFLGHHTPVALGDYLAGPSHVLPTGGTARFANGLCSVDFLKRSSIIEYDRAALAVAADDIATMTEVEGLSGHRASVEIRLQS